jgi:hypothetical protein
MKVTSVCEEIFSFSRAMVWVLLDTPGAALLEKFHFERTAIDFCTRTRFSAPRVVDVPSVGNKMQRVNKYAGRDPWE